jgi:large subunit ribosomal protein L21
MFAVIRTGGKQYRVKEGDVLDIELLPQDKDAKQATISEVLLVGSGEQVKIGKPTVSGAAVTLEVVDSVKARKVVAYKYRRREGYHRTVGHRQKLQRVKVTGIKGA